MDTAFYNRTGFTAGWSFGALNFYPKQGFWLHRVYPYYFTKLGRDRVQNGDEDFLNAGLRFDFTRQGYLQLAHSHGHEPWVGQRFETGRTVDIYGRVQILRWLNVNGSFNNGPQIYYDPLNPFQGESRSTSLGLTLQPNQHLSQNVDTNSVRFDRASSGEPVFSVVIVNLKTTYQFNRHLLARLLEQYDSSSHRLLTDLLGSYEFVPGTVLHAGYGSLVERRSEEGGALVPVDAGGRYVAVSRGLFFKASYLYRF
jgi:hypothetical protein